MLKEDTEHDWAVKQMDQEVEQYKKTLERNRTQFKITEQTAISITVSFDSGSKRFVMAVGFS